MSELGEFERILMINTHRFLIKIALLSSCLAEIDYEKVDICSKARVFSGKKGYQKVARSGIEEMNLA